ncbi:MAG: hypothetical protein MUO58_19020 [Anaerolineales bacterium]|nr:hypothetical protein [Anaerolineales bacterium]
MIGIWFVFGVVIGILNYRMQWRSVNSLHPETSRIKVLWIVGCGALRCTLIAILLLAIFRQGVLPGLLAIAGFWLTRLVVILRLGLALNPGDPSQYMIEE